MTKEKEILVRFNNYYFHNHKIITLNITILSRIISRLKSFEVGLFFIQNEQNYFLNCQKQFRIFMKAF